MRLDREVPGSIPADAARRYESVRPMELSPGNRAGPRAVTWGLSILDKGGLGFEVPHEPGECSIVAYIFMHMPLRHTCKLHIYIKYDT